VRGSFDTIGDVAAGLAGTATYSLAATAIGMGSPLRRRTRTRRDAKKRWVASVKTDSTHPDPGLC
jgi:hypothetical protein